MPIPGRRIDPKRFEAQQGQRENMSLEETLQSLLPEGWETDGYGLESNLIAPDGCMIEQDGHCPHGYISPLRSLGLI